MQNRPLASAASILTGMAVIGLIDQSVRLIAESSSLWTFHALRTVMIWALALAFLWARGQRLMVRNWPGLVARSAITSVSMVIYFGALAFLPVAQVAAGLFTAPIWVLIFSVAVFGMGIGKWRILAVCLGFVGILLVLSPDPATVSPWVFMPVLAGAFYAVGVIATRAWCPEESALALSLGIFTALGLWGLAGGVAMTLWAPEAPLGPAGFLARGWVWPDAAFWLWTFVQAIGSLVAVTCLTRGYQLADASYATVFEYSMLIFSAFFGWMIWGETLGILGGLGMVLIAVAGSIIALRGQTIEVQPA